MDKSNIDSTNNLDSIETILSADSTCMSERLAGFHLQCASAWADSNDKELPPEYSRSKQIAIVGMGGSAISGNLAENLFRQQSSVPISVIRSSVLPKWVDKKTLVIACSYSGNTKETLSIFDDAIKRGCQVICSTSGGILQENSNSLNVPSLSIDFIGEPRSAIGYSFFNLVSILDRLGFIPNQHTYVTKAIEQLKINGENWNLKVPTKSNYAKQIATRIRHNLPIIIGYDIFESVARRWKTQFNENSKSIAIWEAIPEFLHNGVEAFQSTTYSAFVPMVILLKPQTAKEQKDDPFINIVKYLQGIHMPYELVKVEEMNTMAQILTAVQLGDYVSYYLALLKNTDPGPVNVIESLKYKKTNG